MMRFQNPILSGFHPDPSICRVGDDYFLVTSSFEYFPGLPLFQSRDLVHWRQVGHILERQSQMPGRCPGPSGGIFAPTLRFHEGVFYLITTNIGGGGNFVVTATDPSGPWSDPFWIEGAEGIDPSLFFDDDGRCWYVGNGNPVQSLYEGHHTIWLQEFDNRAMRLVGEKQIIVDGGSDITKQPIWIEGPHLYKNDSRYYLLAAEGGTAEDHSVVVFRSDSITGPYESFQGNPILTNRDLDPSRADPITCTGHADLVQTQAGEWWIVLLACRPYPPGEENDCRLGRETFLAPVAWQDGWPVTADGTGHLASAYAMPDLPVHPWVDGYGLGELHWHDDFAGASLRPEWNQIGPPEEIWHSLAVRPGFLHLSPRPQRLTGLGQPSFLGIRQRHQAFTAETTLEFHPAAEGDAAGLVVMQNRRGFYALDCVQISGQIHLRLIKQAPENGNAAEFRAETRLAGGKVSLRVEVQSGSYVFSYAEADGAWRRLHSEEDVTVLSTRRAGGFVGAYIGLYATSQAAASSGTADFDGFTYHGKD